MKKILCGFLAIMVSMTLFAERITSDDASLVANNFMNGSSSVAGMKKAPAKRMVMKAAAEENMFYVYENANGEGWVLVAADDAVAPILAYSETGTFRTDNLPRNVRGWLGKYNKFIKKVEADGAEATAETAEEWNMLRAGARRAKGDAVVGPLVKTQWDQDAPYYNLCPGTGSNKAYTGCVATAMAQVMKYWEWPVKGNGSHSYKPRDPNNPDSYSSRYKNELSADFGNTTYDWANMLNKYSGTYTTAQGNAVATLMYHCGVATEMMYGNDADGGSGTYTVNYGDWDWGTTTTNEGGCAQNALWYYFGYKQSTLTGYMRDGYSEGGVTYYEKWSDADWTAMIKEELDKKHPIMYGGAGSGGGHSFICDGYDDAGYFHFNWGWSGSNDGYYKLSSLKPGSGGAGGGSYDFSEDQDAIIGIVPDKKDLPKVTVTWSVEGDETDVEFTQEDALVLPDAPADCENGKVFVGWTANAEVDGEKPADLFNKAAGKTVTEDITYYAVFAFAEEGGGTSEVSDKLTRATTGVEGNSYTSWSGKKVNSEAVYAGLSAGGNESIQLRTKNSNEGIVTTATGGVIAKITVEWNSNTTDGRKVDIYGRNTAYSDPSDLYGDNQGTKIGTIEYGKVTELSVSGDYQYVGVRSNNSALYMTSITFTWNAAGGVSYSYYSLTCSGEAPEPVYYNIRFFDNGIQIGETQSVLRGQQAEVPIGPDAVCEGYQFEGWWTEELPIDNTEAKTWVTNFKATKDQDYHAIFSHEKEGGEGLSNQYKKITAANELETANYIVAGDYNNGYHAMKNELANTYYIAAQDVTPSSDVITTTDAGIIWKITVSGDNLTFYNEAISKYVYMYHPDDTHYNVGFTSEKSNDTGFSFMVNNGSWDFISTTFTDRYMEYYGSKGNFSAYKQAGDPIYLYKQQYGATTVTYYSSVVDCTQTDVDIMTVAPKAVKAIQNGQVVIIRDGVSYSILGQPIR